MPPITAAPSGGAGTRSIPGLMRQHWSLRTSRSPGAISLIRRSRLTFSARSRRTSRVAASRATVLVTRRSATTPLMTLAPTPSSAPQERQAMENHHRRGRSAKRGLARDKIPGPPPWRRWSGYHSWSRCETKVRCVNPAGAAPHDTGLRLPGCRDQSPHRRPEQLHSARHTHH